MSPLVPLVAGIAALAAGVLILRTYGPAYRVGRLLASTPTVGVDEAIRLAAGPGRFVRVDGRIDAEDEFEDDAHRPLVFRRTRLQVRAPGSPAWMTVEDRRERVHFELREGLDSIEIDDAALDSGLVVIPREAVGTAADVADRVPAGTPGDSVVRLLVEQISSVEHAIALGVPRLAEDGRVRLTGGLGRPLILTTLERDEAIRVLSRGDRRRPLAALAFLAGGAGMLAIAMALAAAGTIR